MDGRKSYLNLKDMFDGGGMGQAGAKFEGGGLLSMLGNALGIAPYGAARERDLELAANALAGVAIKPDVVKPLVDAEQKAVGGLPMDGAPGFRDSRQPGMGDIRQTTLPPAPQPSFDPRGPMYGDQNAVTDQQLMQFAQTMHPDNRYFFLNSDRGTQVRSYLQAMGY